MAVIFFTFCLILATSAAMPRGDNGNRMLKGAAISILARAEHRGGEILNKVLIERSFAKGRTVSNPAVLLQAQQFLEDVLSEVTAFKTLVQTGAQSRTALPAEDRLQRPGHFPSFPSIVIPPGFDLEDLVGLTYEEILAILADYTKGFMETLVPASPIFVDRDILLGKMHAVVDKVFDQLREIVPL